MVKGKDLQPRGRGFESWRWKLDGKEAKVTKTLKRKEVNVPNRTQ